MKDLQDQLQTFLFARAWMQWYGGLGIVVLTVALLFRPGAKTKQFAVTEAKEEYLVGGTKAHARRVLKDLAVKGTGRETAGPAIDNISRPDQ